MGLQPFGNDRIACTIPLGLGEVQFSKRALRALGAFIFSPLSRQLCLEGEVWGICAIGCHLSVLTGVQELQKSNVYLSLANLGEGGLVAI
ncbi:hypothetical protein [Sphingomonas sp. R86521]|uniref:hypothetical protein n=1 Tax=Sphingomonas sp. R86521 TaxID=3093860 RepID=UPI0036D26319